MGIERHHSALIAASVITVASFVGATAYTQNRLARLDSLSSTLETNAVPSVEYLSSAAVRLTRLSQWLNDVAATGRRHASAIATARDEVRALDDDLTRYLRLTPLPGESDFWTALRTDLDHALQLLRAALDAEQAGRPAAPEPGPREVDQAIDQALATVLATLDFDVRQSQAMARDVRTVRVATLRMIVMLDAAATAIALFAVLVAYRASRRHDALLDEHNALLTARVTELDRFAGRVAHDVLSPLGTIAVALPLLARSADARDRTYIDRSQRALQRVQQLVEGLLVFARSGARPDPSSRCALDGVLAGIVADCSETAADKGIEVVVQASAPMQVPCSQAVIASIVQNLVRNAIKYMGVRPVRRIVVRAKPAGPMARLEVEDTGPGIPVGLREAIFDPFVRGPNEQANGTGLGLATVKRLAEAHGGAVGVRTPSGGGALFWVELPLVFADVEAGAHSIEAGRR
jgi:signal transduction histidine kinase